MKKVLILAVALTASLGQAAEMTMQHQDRDRGERRGPPQVAIDACSSSSAGGACSFIGRRDDTITGACESIHGDQLVCVPEGGPPSMRRSDNRGG